MPLPTYNPLTLQECLEPIIRQIFYQAVLKDQSELSTILNKIGILRKPN